MASTPAGTSLPLRGVVGGVALLAVVGGFAIGLPKVDAGPGGSDGAPSLPSSLPAGLVAADDAAAGPLAGRLDGEALRELEARAVASLTDFYGAAGAYRYYVRAVDGELGALGSVTILDTAPGPFVTDALPLAASDPATARPSALVQRLGAATCEVTWGDPVPAGQTPDPAQLPGQVRCQQGTDQTVLLSVSGLDLAEVEQVLAALPGGEESAQDQ